MVLAFKSRRQISPAKSLLSKKAKKRVLSDDSDELSSSSVPSKKRKESSPTKKTVPVINDANEDTPFTTDCKSEFTFTSEPIYSDSIKEALTLTHTPQRNCLLNIGMAMECPENCDGESSCKNKQVSSLRAFNKNNISYTRVTGRVLRHDTKKKKGDGLFAAKDIAPREVIIEYTGVVCCLDDDKGQGFPNSEYLIQLEGKYYIQAETYGNISRFINHSCDPNAKVEKPKLNISIAKYSNKGDTSKLIKK